MLYSKKGNDGSLVTSGKLPSIRGNGSKPASFPSDPLTPRPSAQGLGRSVSAPEASDKVGSRPPPPWMSQQVDRN